MNCKNCGSWIDTGEITGYCSNEKSPYFREVVRYDFRCCAHLGEIHMLHNTVAGRM